MSQMSQNKRDIDKLIEELTRVNGLNNLKKILEKLLVIVSEIDTKDERYEELKERVERLEGYTIYFEDALEIKERHCLGRPIDPLIVIDGVKALATVINSSDMNEVTVRFSKKRTGYLVIR